MTSVTVTQKDVTITTTQTVPDTESATGIVAPVSVSAAQSMTTATSRVPGTVSVLVNIDTC